MLEVIRRLRLHPDVRYVSTSVHKDNSEAEQFYRSLGFVDDPKKDPVEVYLFYLRRRAESIHRRRL